MAAVVPHSDDFAGHVECTNYTPVTTRLFYMQLSLSLPYRHRDRNETKTRALSALCVYKHVVVDMAVRSNNG